MPGGPETSPMGSRSSRPGEEDKGPNEKEEQQGFLTYLRTGDQYPRGHSFPLGALLLEPGGVPGKQSYRRGGKPGGPVSTPTGPKAARAD